MVKAPDKVSTKNFRFSMIDSIVEFSYGDFVWGPIWRL